MDVNENASLQDNLSMIRGRHTFKTGYEILANENQFASGTAAVGNVSAWVARSFLSRPIPVNPFASFLLGAVTRADFTKALATWLPQWWSHALYFQDDWKVTKNLTLNLGVRWQTESPYRTKYGQQSQFDPTATDPLTGRRGALAASHWSAGQPRCQQLPAASRRWPTTSGRTGCSGAVSPSTRSICGRTVCGRTSKNTWRRRSSSSLSGNPDIAFKLSKGPPPINFNIQPDGSAPFIGTNYSGRSASYYDPAMRSPYVMNWNVGVQRQFGRDYLLGIHLPGLGGRWFVEPLGYQRHPPEYLERSGPVGNHPPRAAELSDRIRSSGACCIYSNYGHSSFHSGTVKVEKRMSSGLSFTSFYTCGKSIDEASDDGTATGVTYYNRRLDKARSNYDVAHRWITYAIWDLPFGKGKKFLSMATAWRQRSSATGSWRRSKLSRPGFQ